MIEESVGDRLTLLETAVAYLVDRQGEVQQLVDATDRLAASTLKVEEALRMVSDVKLRQEQLTRTVKKVSRRGPSRGRLFVIAACIAVLVAVTVYGLHDRSLIHHELRHLETCQSHPLAAMCSPPRG